MRLRLGLQVGKKKLKVAKNPKIKYRILFWKEIRKLKLNSVLNSTTCLIISQAYYEIETRIASWKWN